MGNMRPMATHGVHGLVCIYGAWVHPPGRLRVVMGLPYVAALWLWRVLVHQMGLTMGTISPSG